jgi:hypothetical protein
MNSATVKLFLTLLWLVSAVGLLAHDLATSRAVTLPFGRWQMPLAWLCLVLTAFNFVRWYSARSPVRPQSRPYDRRRHREPVADEPDPNFRLDEPPETSRRGT